MKTSKRKLVYNKYDGKCAYTGKPLGDNWQVGHMVSKQLANYYKDTVCVTYDVDDINNLMPALRIVNHYKRALDLNRFREYMLTFHLRLAELPKNPCCEKTIKRKEYMYKVADAFGITVDKPFNGIFYFETLNSK